MTNQEKVEQLTKEQLVRLLAMTARWQTQVEYIQQQDNLGTLMVMALQFAPNELRSMIIHPFDLSEGYVQFVWKGMTIGMAPDGRTSS